MAFAVLMIALSGCNEEEFLGQKAPFADRTESTLRIYTEKPESRSTILADGTFYWLPTDTIGVYGQMTVNSPFSFSGQQADEATFTGELASPGEKAVAGYYPYRQGTTLTGSTLTFTIPQDQTAYTENRSPMVGCFDGEGALKFYYTGGILQLSIMGLPEDASTLVVESVGEKAAWLAGEAVIDDINKPGCTYRMTEGTNRVTYDVSKFGRDGTITNLSIPLAVGKYDRLEVSLLNVKGMVIKKNTLSSLTVSRARITVTPILNYSDVLYAYELPEEYIKDMECDRAVVFSNHLMVTQTAYGGGTKYTVSQMFRTMQGEKEMMVIQCDSLNRVINLSTSTFSVFLEYTGQMTADMLLVAENYIGEKKQVNLESRIASRAGVEGGVLDEMTQALGFVSSIAGFVGGFTGVGDAVLGTLNAINGTWHVGQVSDRKLKYIADSLVNAVGFVLATMGLVAASAASAPAIIIVGLGVAAITAAIAVFTNPLAYIENVIIENIYHWVCGDAKVTTLVPELVGINKFRYGYTVTQSYTKHEVLTKYIHPETGLILKEVNVDKKQPGMNPDSREIVLKDILKEDGRYEDVMEFVRGKAYYTRAYIALSKFYPIHYLGDVECIKFDKATIGKVRVDDGTLSYGTYRFNVRAELDCKLKTSAWGVYVMKDDKSQGGYLWTPDQKQLDFNWYLDREDIDPSSYKAANAWSLMVRELYQNQYDTVDGMPIEFVYRRKPVLKIVEAVLGETKEITGSRANEDDDKKKYETRYRVVVQTGGTGCFSSYTAKQSGMGRIETEGRIPTDENEHHTFYGYIRYAEGDALPTVTCEGTKLDGSAFSGQGQVVFEGTPINRLYIKR